MFKFSVLLCSTLLLITYACSKDQSTDEKDKNYTSLIGYWKLKSGITYAKKDDGTIIQTATLKEGVFAHEFFDNGAYIGHVLVSSPPSESGTWKLEVNTLDNEDIESGTLSITTASSKASAGQSFVDADGSQKYEISTINAPIDGSKSIMTLTTKKYESYPYSENWAVYVYQKQ